jgi:hypothetical protein
MYLLAWYSFINILNLRREMCNEKTDLYFISGLRIKEAAALR